MSDFYYNDSELQMDSSLILCIEEHDGNGHKNPVDNRIFIGYDHKDDDYYLRGKRQDTSVSDYVPYAFRCDAENKLFEFLDFVIGTRENVSIALYNYNNIVNKETDSLTYDFFEEHMDPNYEIAAYDNTMLNRFMMSKHLKMLKNFYNWEWDQSKKNICNT
jgi:hypothetical protein